MGMSTNAILVYGYHLGGDDGGWLLENAGEDGEMPPLDWYDDETEDDFQEASETRLLATLAGFTETDWRVDGYFARRQTALDSLGIGLETHCSADYPGYLLVTKRITAYRGDVTAIDFEALHAEARAAGADVKLRAALDALSLKPTQERAQWLLCSYWG